MNEVVRTPVPSDSLEVVKYLRRQIASFSELPKPVQRSCAVRLVQVCHAGRWSVSRCVERRCPKPGRPHFSAPRPDGQVRSKFSRAVGGLGQWPSG